MDDLAPLIGIFFTALIPIVAIVGGVTTGIIKSNARRRLLELAQQERIAAIERGIDLDRLPKLHIEPYDGGLTFEQRQLRRSQALMIWGLVLTIFGLMFYLVFSLVEHSFTEGAPALLFFGVGVALLISGRMVRPNPDDLRRSSSSPSQV